MLNKMCVDIVGTKYSFCNKEWEVFCFFEDLEGQQENKISYKNWGTVGNYLKNFVLVNINFKKQQKYSKSHIPSQV